MCDMMSNFDLGFKNIYKTSNPLNLCGMFKNERITIEKDFDFLTKLKLVFKHIILAFII